MLYCFAGKCNKWNDNEWNVLQIEIQKFKHWVSQFKTHTQIKSNQIKWILLRLLSDSIHVDGQKYVMIAHILSCDMSPQSTTWVILISASDTLHGSIASKIPAHLWLFLSTLDLMKCIR